MKRVSLILLAIVGFSFIGNIPGWGEWRAQQTPQAALGFFETSMNESTPEKQFAYLDDWLKNYGRNLKSTYQKGNDNDMALIKLLNRAIELGKQLKKDDNVVIFASIEKQFDPKNESGIAGDVDKVITDATAAAGTRKTLLESVKTDVETIRNLYRKIRELREQLISTPDETSTISEGENLLNDGISSNIKEKILQIDNLRKGIEDKGLTDTEKETIFYPKTLDQTLDDARNELIQYGGLPGGPDAKKVEDSYRQLVAKTTPGDVYKAGLAWRETNNGKLEELYKQLRDQKNALNDLKRRNDNVTNVDNPKEGEISQACQDLNATQKAIDDLLKTCPSEDGLSEAEREALASKDSAVKKAKTDADTLQLSISAQASMATECPGTAQAGTGDEKFTKVGEGGILSPDGQVETNTDIAVTANTGTGEATNTDTGETTNTDTGETTNTDTGEATNTDTGEATNTDTGETTNTGTGKATNTNTGETTNTSTGATTDKPHAGETISIPVDVELTRQEEQKLKDQGYTVMHDSRGKEGMSYPEKTKLEEALKSIGK